MRNESPLNESSRHTRPSSAIDTTPPINGLDPRAAFAPPLFGPSLTAAFAADGIVNKAMQLLEWWKYSRIGRGLKRYTTKRGNLLAGGISYVALFSISAAVAIGWTIFMYVLGGNAELRHSLIDAINSAMPGLLKDGSGNGGMVDPESLRQDSLFTVTGIVGVVALLFSASKVMAALKMSLWSMFGVVRLPDNPVVIKVRDFIGFLIIALSVVATATLGVLTNTLGSWFLNVIGLEGGLGSFLLRFGSLLTAFVVDTVLVVLLIRFVAGMRTPWKDLWTGAAIVGVGSAVLRYLGTSVIGAVDDPLLAGGAAVVTLMLWINLIARVVLMVAAWMANPPFAAVPNSPEHIHGRETPNYVTMSKPETLAWPHHTMTGDLEPDPWHNPDDEEIVLDSVVWNSVQARRLRKRIEKADADADQYRRQLWAMGTVRKIAERDE
ncbi:MAG: YihY/virulence factor BrkB family protein [Actinomycetaceae bacterium]|nr:YihY/virulence factor BrkB family protein [Actinomycetaceae bacterium]